MGLTMLSTSINSVAIRCEWSFEFGLCSLYLDKQRKRVFTAGGKLKRTVCSKIGCDSVSLEFVPLDKGNYGLFILKKNGVLYKATGFSFLASQFVAISSLPLSSWR